ncbi:hypothetical protein [Streptomyces sp. NPDC021356]|uniref:hypothetical protein n=1 Tax=Streptomyces sp. NPDC021356 TaxID=3154900 RepID=UPI0033EBB81C
MSAERPEQIRLTAITGESVPASELWTHVLIDEETREPIGQAIDTHTEWLRLDGYWFTYHPRQRHPQPEHPYRLPAAPHQYRAPRQEIRGHMPATSSGSTGVPHQQGGKANDPGHRQEFS